MEQNGLDDTIVFKLDDNVKISTKYTYTQFFQDDEEVEIDKKRIVKISNKIHFTHNSKNLLILHWGFGFKNIKEWNLPDKKIHPPNTKVFDKKAVQTSFESDESIEVCFDIDEIHSPKALNFVIFDPNSVK